MMRKFQFGLQRLLDYREIVEESLLAELGALQAKHDNEVAKLVNMRRDRDLFRKSMKHQLSDGSSDEIRDAYDYLQQLIHRCVEQELQVRQVTEEKNAKLEEVVEASKDRKLLERLKEHKTKQHRKEISQQEQKFLDDLASIRFNRSSEADECRAGGAS